MTERTTRPRRGWFCGAFTSTAILSSTALAADPIAVDARGCTGLDVHETERLLSIELLSVAKERGQAEPPAVQLVCDGELVRIEVRDPITDKRLEREIPAPRPDEPGRERVLALAASQLFLTSWLELLLPEQPEASRPRPAVRAQERKAAEQMARGAILPSSSRWEITAAGAAHLRDLHQTFIAWQPSLRAAFAFGEHFRVLGQAGFEFGQASRLRGKVDASSGLAGFGLGWRVGVHRKVGLEAAVVASTVYVHLEGQASQLAVEDTSASGLGAEIALSVGPTLSAGALRGGLEAQAGWLLPSVTARVSQERAVELSGPWIGAALRVGLDLAP
jgi:hypothetical protein